MPTDNPYAVDSHSPTPERPSPGGTELSRSILVQIRVVGVLLIVHGLLICLAATLLIFMAAVMPSAMAAQQANIQPQRNVPSPEQMGRILLFVYGGMGAVGLLVGGLQFVAGCFNLALRKRTLGIIALVAGSLAILTCYCAPTAIALMVYGLVVYLHDTSRKAFQLREQGLTWAEIDEFAR